MQKETTPTIYWHDYETFGLNRYVDRPVQFAGMRTTMSFEPVGEPDLLYCRPSMDYLPQPEACMVTCITPQEAREKGMAEVEFARQIYSRFNTPNTLVIGYNNLRFDDEVTRALFWRNLRDMYRHQWADGCSRWDLFPFVQAVWALRDEGIVWPKRGGDDPEKADWVTFRLEKLTEANGITHTHAHDALSDVEATCALARLIAQKQPNLWKWALENRHKPKVVQALSQGRPAVWVDSSAGQAAGFLRFVLPVAQSESDKNVWIVWDCRFDPSELIGLSDEEIRRRAFLPKSLRLPDDQPLPLFRLRVNTSPFVCASLGVVNDRVCQRFGIDLNRILENGQKLTEISNTVAGTVMSAEKRDFSDQVSRDAEEDLYGNLVSNQDRFLCNHVLELTPEKLAIAVDEGRIHFDDPKLDTLLFRLRARNYPETLSEDEQRQWKKHCAQFLSGELPQRLGFNEYFEKIDALNESISEQLEEGVISETLAQSRQDVLDALYEWGECLGAMIHE